jgi:uncharacterized protein YbjT (DUF2867 family)
MRILVTGEAGFIGSHIVEHFQGRAEVRVPPSAWSTSQSTQTVRSPSLLRSSGARMARPMSRWISCDRPSIFPFALSRCFRCNVE